MPSQLDTSQAAAPISAITPAAIGSVLDLPNGAMTPATASLDACTASCAPLASDPALATVFSTDLVINLRCVSKASNSFSVTGVAEMVGSIRAAFSGFLRASGCGLGFGCACFAGAAFFGCGLAAGFGSFFAAGLGAGFGGCFAAGFGAGLGSGSSTGIVTSLAAGFGLGAGFDSARGFGFAGRFCFAAGVGFALASGLVGDFAAGFASTSGFVGAIAAGLGLLNAFNGDLLAGFGLNAASGASM